MTEKKCPRCGQVKPVSEWYLSRRKAGGKAPYGACKVCVRAYQMTFRNKNKKRINARKMELYFLNEYGLTLKQRRAMFDRQRGKCAICRRPPSEKSSLHIDHNHSTGAVREMLCMNCNRILGDCREKIKVLLAAAEYLIRHKPARRIERTKNTSRGR